MDKNAKRWAHFASGADAETAAAGCGGRARWAEARERRQSGMRGRHLLATAVLLEYSRIMTH
eukprot:2359540-Prymnesium_polylepis.1